MSTAPIREQTGSDEKLRQLQFRYEDPESSILNLNRAIPDPDAGVSVIGYYDQTPAGGKLSNPDFPYIWCCHCQKRTHWKGYVIRTGRGDIHIIGQKSCGRLHYGVDFGSAEQSFKQQHARQRSLERLDRIYAVAGPAIAQVTALLGSDSLKAADRVRNSLKAAAPLFFNDLCGHIRSGTVMKIHQSIRDFAAEEERSRRFERAVAAFEKLPAAVRRERRQEGLEPEEDDTPIIRRTVDEYGQVTGGAFLVEQGDLRSGLLGLRTALHGVVAAMEAGTDDCSSRQLQALTAGYDQAQRECFEMADRVGLVPLFFGADNLGRLASWAKRREGLILKVAAQALTVHEDGRVPATIASFAVTDLTQLRTILAGASA